METLSLLRRRLQLCSEAEAAPIDASFPSSTALL